MIVYHFGWDLSYYGYLATDVTTDLGWVLLQRTILSSFLSLVGVGLVLGHGSGIRWPAFWRRFGILAAAALAVTLGTWWMFPDYFVYFGILHAIAAFSLAALPFLRLRLWVLLAVAALFLLAPQLFGSPQFGARHLAWIGFWTVLPDTTDIVPFFPWFAVVLLGMAGTRLLLASPAAGPVAAWPARGRLLRALVWCGRHSLLIYLLHQPLLLGLLAAVSTVLPPAPAPLQRDADFIGSCEAGCAEPSKSMEQRFGDLD